MGKFVVIRVVPVFLLLALALGLILLPQGLQTVKADNGTNYPQRLSVTSSGVQGNGDSNKPQISTNGRYIVFTSESDNLVAGDSNYVLDCFLRDTQSNTTEIVSLADNETQGDGESNDPTISSDGRYIAFSSYSNNLVSGDTNGVEDVFVRDRTNGTTIRISVATDGTQGDGVSHYPVISANGLYVVFDSAATNLVAGDTNALYDVFVRDLVNNTTTRISVATDGTQATGGQSFDGYISANGQFITYQSAATNLVSGDTNENWDIFLRDTVNNTTTRVSVADDESEANGGSSNPFISASGRYIVFQSGADNLIGTGNDTNYFDDIFVRDTTANTTTRVSVADGSPGAEGNGPVSSYFSITSDGRFVLFTSLADNLVTGDTNGVNDVFVRDTVNSVTTRVSVTSAGAQVAGSSRYAMVAADGGYVAFLSSATTLVSGDTNGVGDVFLATRGMTYTVSGTVRDGSSNPMSGVTISSGLGDTTTTAGDGSYSFTLTAGTYTFSATADCWGFSPATLSVTVPGSSTGRDFSAFVNCSISGHIQEGTGTAISGVTVSDGAGHSATTNASGDYTITGLSVGTYNISASRTGYTFSPASRSVTVPPFGTSQDFTGTGIHTISGHIQTGGGSPISGVTVSDGAGHTATTNVSGDYTISGVPPGTYTVSASLSNYTFTPTSRSVTVPPNATGVNFSGSAVYTISGHIQDGSSNPIVGVTVSAGSGYTATTNASGDYTISSLPPGTYTITPTLNCYSFSPASLSVTVPPTATAQNFTATANCSISGHIQNGSGTAISGVTVSDGAGHSATTNASGNYTITGLTAGSYTISASLTGYTFLPASRSVSLPPNSTGQDFTGSGSLTISGHIQNGSGTAITGVTVSAGSGYTTTTDASGNYTISNLPPGTYTITPSLNCYSFSPASLSVTVPPNATAQNFTATAICSISGHIQDTLGAAISGVTVSDGAGHTATTNASGDYTITGLTAGSYTISASLTGYTFSPTSLAVTLPPNSSAQNFTGTGIYTISGHVQDGSGTAIAGVTISTGTGYSTTTNASGDYTLSNLPPGSYTITPTANCYSFSPTNYAVTVPPNSTARNFTASGTCTISGHIQNGSGTAITGVTVSAGSGYTATTDASGNYTISNLPPGTYTVTPSLNCYSFSPASLSVTVPPNATAQNFTATAICSISGHIQNSLGSAISGVTVSDGSGHSATTNASGDYTITGLTAGSYTLSASLTGYTFAPTSLAVTLPPNSTGQDFTGTGIYTISGHIQNGSGTAISGVTVSTGTGYSATTNASGDYTLTNLPPGSYTITPTANCYGFSPTNYAVTLPPNSTTRNFTASGNCTISGHIQNGSGTAIAGVSVSAGGGYTATTNASGDYTISNLPPGTYTVTPSLNCYSFSPVSLSVTVPPNATAQNFTGTANCSISGHVQDALGAALSGVTVSDGAGHSAATNASGDYTISGLPAGSYTISASLTGYTFSPTSRAITLPPNSTAQNFTGTGIYTISGHIQNGSGAAISGVTVSAGSGYTATTNASGDYTLSNLPPGTFTVTPSRTGYTFSPTSRSVTTPPNATAIDFTGTGIHTISGHIQNGSGTAVAGVTVSAGSGYTATTNASGDYTISSLPPGTYTITPTLNCYSFSPASLSVTVPPTATAQNFTATANCSISGHIQNGSGTAISGVTVSDGAGHSATTNASGNYTITGLTAGSYTISASLTGYTFLPASRSVSLPPNSTGQDFTGSGSLTISGHIQNGSGTAITGVTVSAGSGYTTTTDASGNYTISNLPPGTYTITPSLNCYSFSPASLSVTVPPNATAQNFTATAICSISGHIQDTLGAAISGVTVSDGAGHTATTNASGDYTITGLTAGSYTISASLTGYTFSPTSLAVTLPPNSSAQNFTGTGIYTISGHVQDGSGTAIAGVTISTGTGYSTTTNASGDYTLSNLPPGSYTITPTANCYSFSPTNYAVTVPPNSTARNFTASGTCTISGHIQNGSGTAITGVTVSAGSGYTATTDASGNYTISNLPPGTYTVTPSLNCYSFSPASLSVTVPPNATAQNFTATAICSISGHIQNSLGSAISGVTVSDGSGHSATTNASGDYTITGLTAGSYTLSASLTGYTFAPTSLAVTLPPNSTGQDFTGTGIYTISGHIQNGSGTAISGVTVSTGTGYSATTNASGDYTLTNLPPGSYTITPTANCYGFSPTNYAVTLPPNSTTRNFTASGNCTISGHIQNGSGTAIAGVSVSAGGGYTATTNASGDYTISNLPPGTYTVTPSLNCYSFSPVSLSVTVPPNATAQNFTGTANCSISGHVQDALGAALSGVTVSDGAGHSAATNASGDYTISGLPAGSYTISASLTGYTFSPTSRAITLPPNSTAQNFTGTGIYTISGHIQNGSGAAISGVTVSAGSGYTATTNASGDYTLSNLPPGTFTVTPSRTGYTFSPTSRSVTTPPNATAIDFTGTGIHTISGHIQNGSGTAVAGVTVSAGSGYTATTNASGDYTISSLPPGTYTITPTLNCYSFSPASLSVTVPPTATAQNFTATANCSISGHIQNGSGTAISGVTVSDGAGHSATTNASGNYTITGLTAGSYTISASLTGYTFLPASRSVSLPPNSTGQDFTGTGIYTISGHIQDGSSNPISGVTVSTGTGYSATTNASGNYTISNVPPGTYTVSASQSGFIFTPTSRSVTVPPNATAIDFTGASVYTISGHIQDGSGNPISGITVSDGAGHSATTNASGNYTIADVPPGTYTVSPSHSGYTFSPTSRSVTLPPDATSIDFTATGIYSISGHVQDGSANPMSGVTISDGAGHSAITNASGDYTISQLGPGSYSLSAAKTGYSFSPTSRGVPLPPTAVSQNFTGALLPAPAPTLVTPAESETVTTFTPTYTWNEVTTATLYKLFIGKTDGSMIFAQWYTASAVCSGGTCSIKPTQIINAGQNRWCVKSYNDSGGAWSTCNTFNSPGAAGKPTLTSPTGGTAIPSFYPTYQWNDIAIATQYKLVVYNAGGVQVFAQWFTREQANCLTGGICSISPDTALGTGLHTWYIKSYNPSGGEWSNPATFSTPTTAAGAPVLISPSGTVSGINPTFQWTGDATATYYKLYVISQGGVVVLSQWYTPSEANCKGTTGCSVMPTLTLAPGNYTWYVKSFNPVGGAWSPGKDFIAE